jgi:hypothetical protein
MRLVSKYAGVVVVAATMASASGALAQQTRQMSLPQVTVTAPAAPVVPPYLTSPGRSYERNPYAGRYRVEEDKFPEVPCNVTRIASAAGGKCLQGYRLMPGLVATAPAPIACDMGLDVVIYNTGKLSVEADTLIFDPYKLTAIGYHNQNCYINGNTGYDQQDFQDMNQVTRRGTNWHNLIGDGEDKSIEFSAGPHNCVAIKKPGPRWLGGYVYMLHASICRTDTAAVRPEDVSYALGSLELRQYDPVGNLRKAGE